MNQLYYGDNLEVLRRHIKDESVDLIYLDPPFNSNANYNVLFAEHETKAAAQIKAFVDTWEWDEVAARAYQEVVEAGGKVSQVMQAFRTFLGESDMLAYTSMMAPRLVELRRVLKPTGSIYVHCDPTASHYLKLLMDAVFGPVNFRNEIRWKRTHGHGDSKKRFANISDTLLFYAKSAVYTFNPQYAAYSAEYTDTYYRHVDESGRRYQLVALDSPHPRPNLTYDYKGYKPPRNGWRVSLAKMEQLDAEGRLQFPSRPQGVIRRRYYLDEMQGVVLGDNWTDIPPISAQAKERLGYPTQKPVALLERILQASSNEGDNVLDPFCGCGTTVHAAQKLNRQWIGIDITSLATSLIKTRLHHAFGKDAVYQVVGEPTTTQDAELLAKQDPYQFQWWSLGLVEARPVEQKKGADKGIDGRLYFHDDQSGKTRQVIFSVKAGNLQAQYVRDLRGVIEREKAEIGVLITMKEPTKPMRQETASAGFYHSPGWNRDYPRLQILTVGELLSGKRVDMPPTSQVNITFKKAAKEMGPKAIQNPFDFTEDI